MQFPSNTLVLWSLNPNSSGVKRKNQSFPWTHWYVKPRKIRNGLWRIKVGNDTQTGDMKQNLESNVYKDRLTRAKNTEWDVPQREMQTQRQVKPSVLRPSLRSQSQGLQILIQKSDPETQSFLTERKQSHRLTVAKPGQQVTLAFIQL